MAKLVLRDSAYNGIQGERTIQLKYSENYKKLVQEANKQIKKGRQKEREAWIRASKY